MRLCNSGSTPTVTRTEHRRLAIGIETTAESKHAPEASRNQRLVAFSISVIPGWITDDDSCGWLFARTDQLAGIDGEEGDKTECSTTMIQMLRRHPLDDDPICKRQGFFARCRVAIVVSLVRADGWRCGLFAKEMLCHIRACPRWSKCSWNPQLGRRIMFPSAVAAGYCIGTSEQAKKRMAKTITSG